MNSRMQVVLVWTLAGLAGSGPAAAQTGKGPTADGPRFEHLYDIPHKGDGMPMTMLPDAAGRPFLYVAAKEAGLLVYDVKGTPKLARSIPIADLGSRHVMSLSQAGNRIYLALGNHWGKPEGAGLAVIDVAKPAEAAVAGVWKDSEAGGAGGAVVVSGKTAYLAAMQAGLVALDVGDPAAIKVVGRLRPDPAFPDARPDKSKVNARGLALQKDRLFLCYDAGGVRVIDVADPKKPAEVGRYANPALEGRPRAYNNIVLNGSLAYVAADYVGLEILDVADPKAIKLISWWNPWNPKVEGLRWFTSPGHANELAYDPKGKVVLMAAGRSDLVAVSVSDPAKPRQVGGFGDVDDRQATWGLALHGDVVYLSYIRTLGIPFRADWPGVKAYRYRP